MKPLPVIYSMFDVDSLAALPEEVYGLSLVRCQLIKGTVRATYEVTSSRGKYILCFYRYNDRTAAEIEAEIQFMEHLANYGVPVPSAQRQLNGQMMLSIFAPEGERFAILFTYIPGQQLSKQPDTKIIKSLGRVLAQLHQVADELPGRLNRPILGIALLERAVNEFASAAPERGNDIAYLQDVLNTLRSELDKLPTDKPAFGLVHGDVIPSNIQVSPDNQRISLLDFDFCGYGWRMWDVANFLAEVAYWKMGEIVADAFMSGYTSLRSISEDEYRTIPLMQTARITASLGTPARYINTWGRAYFSDSIIERQVDLIRASMTLMNQRNS